MGTDLLPAGTGWAGLRLDVPSPRRPGLRVEATGGRRLLVRQAERIVLLGRQRAQHRGVHYCRTGLYRSALPAITADHARRVRETSGGADGWAARWTHQLAAWLRAAAAGPLHAGHWTLAWGMPSWAVAGHWDRLLGVDPDRGHISWFGYGDPAEDTRDVLPMRRLSPVEAGRVKSYRRQYRTGVLPPVLLWWVSGLATLLVVDGHDRITAALAEGGVPEVVVLAPADNPQWISTMNQRTVRAYEERVAHLQRRTGLSASPHVAGLNQRLAADLREIDRTEGRTRAWPLPGGRATWDRLAAELSPGGPLRDGGVCGD